MAYRIRPQHRADDEIRRIVIERVDEADAALSAPRERLAEGVHEARKRFKEIRAVLRLVRKPLGRAFASENTRYRDLARRLAEFREATAMVEAWDVLAAAQPRRFGSPAMARVRGRLAERADTAADGGGAGEDVPAVREALAQARTAVNRWPLKGRGFGLLRPGLHRGYRDGGRRLADVSEALTAGRLHEWRKRVKDQWYHTCLLQRCWRSMLGARRKALKQLSDTLGDEHDLAVMQALLSQEPALFGAASTRAAVADALDKRRGGLQHDALALGRRLYAESPEALVVRWRAYWRIARAEWRRPVVF